MKRILAILAVTALGACAQPNYSQPDQLFVPTPTVDYIQGLDVSSAVHRDTFLNHLAMNYRDFAIYNARTSGFPDIGEIFAQKSVAAFSGETPFPENLDHWQINDKNLRFDLQQACTDLIEALKNDAADDCPEEAARAQYAFDCWVSSSASAQNAKANECRETFIESIGMLHGQCPARTAAPVAAPAEAQYVQQPTCLSQGCVQAAPACMQQPVRSAEYYPDTTGLVAATTNARAREGLVIVNNVNIPQNLIQPQPVVFTQNIIDNSKNGSGGGAMVIPVDAYDDPMIQDELVSRDEFINMIMVLREELAIINKKLDNLPGEKTVLKVQQIPLEPKQTVMEEVFEVHFDFNKAVIKPEYEEVIKQLVAATKANRNVKISVVGHTDTVGTSDFNFALGGRRAEAVKNMLTSYGIPRDQIIAVSSGKNDPKVSTGPNVKNPENRRARVVKEVRSEEPASIPAANMYGIEVLEPQNPGSQFSY